MNARNGDDLSQRQLFLVLRNLIDHARGVRYYHWTPEPLMAMLDVRGTVESNPHGSRSTYVLYNLAPSRREWLRPLFEEIDMVAKNDKPPVDTSKSATGKPVQSPPRQIKGTIEPTKKG
jgi:hypothetical protein